MALALLSWLIAVLNLADTDVSASAAPVFSFAHLRQLKRRSAFLAGMPGC